MVKIVLASKSPRRIELLRMYGLDPVILPAKVDEHAFDSLPPVTRVEAIARAKAEATAALLSEEEEALVIAADTLVERDGVALGKPKDGEDAVAMLLSLSGKEHFVHTGVCLIGQGRTRVFRVTTKVTFYPLTEDFVRAYVKTGEPLDKAGAYGIQGIGSLLVSSIEGEYLNVVGLPCAALERELAAFGVSLMNP